MERFDLERDPHGTRAWIRSLARRPRAALVGLCVTVVIAVASVGTLETLNLPFVTRVRTVESLERIAEEQWCASGTFSSWRGQFRCFLADTQLGHSDWIAYRNELPPGPVRLGLFNLGMHPWTAALLLLALTLVLAWWTRPEHLEVRSNGIRLGRRFIARDALLSCSATWGWLGHRLEVRHADGRWRSRPLRIAHWQLADLLDDLQRLVPDAATAREERDARARIEADAQSRGLLRPPRLPGGDVVHGGPGLRRTSD